MFIITYNLEIFNRCISLISSMVWWASSSLPVPFLVGMNHWEHVVCCCLVLFLTGDSSVREYIAACAIKCIKVVKFYTEIFQSLSNIPTCSCWRTNKVSHQIQWFGVLEWNMWKIKDSDQLKFSYYYIHHSVWKKVNWYVCSRVSVVFLLQQ